MKSKKNIVLVGMMGSGKSSIGKLIAIKKNCDFVDIDNIIEQYENMSIREIFQTKGEKYFRNLEEKISLDYLKLSNQVISLGGGGYININIRKKCKLNSLTFWLNWKTQTLINRLKMSKKRPLILNSNETEIKRIISSRTKIYSAVNYKIDCDKLNKNQIINKILNIYKNEAT